MKLSCRCEKSSMHFRRVKLNDWNYQVAKVRTICIIITLTLIALLLVLFFLFLFYSLLLLILLVLPIFCITFRCWGNALMFCWLILNLLTFSCYIQYPEVYFVSPFICGESYHFLGTLPHMRYCLLYFQHSLHYRFEGTLPSLLLFEFEIYCSLFQF